jgi:hypothetical protein
MKSPTENDKFRVHSEEEIRASGVELRMWRIPHPGVRFDYPVPTISAAKLLCDALARYDVCLHENNIKRGYAHVSGASWRHPELSDGEWCDFDPEEESECQEMEAVIDEAIDEAETLAVN